MIVNPDLVATSLNSPGIVMQKILAIEQEILMINKHERVHIENNGKVRQSMNSCGSCQGHDMAMPDRAKQHENERKKRVETLNEIERLVDIVGKNTSVLVPKTWAGKRVRIILMDE